MCDYTQREYLCGHFRWLASKHCATYKQNIGQRKSPCLPDITAFEERATICGECRLKQEPPQWPFESGKRSFGPSRA